MKYRKLLILIFICFVLVGCSSESGDGAKFKEEYEGYNKEYIALDIMEENPMKYATLTEVNQLVESGSGVIYFGNPDDNVSRKVVDILLGVVHNTDVEEVYYYDDLTDVSGLDEIENKELPMVLFVVDGSIVKYRVGTIDSKYELTEDEVITIYNDYSEGIHKVLGDNCSEEC